MVRPRATTKPSACCDGRTLCGRHEHRSAGDLDHAGHAGWMRIAGDGSVGDGYLEGAAEAVAGRVLERVECHQREASHGPGIARYEPPFGVDGIDRDVTVQGCPRGALDADGPQCEGVIQRGGEVDDERIPRAG